MRAASRALLSAVLLAGVASCGSTPGLTHELSGYVRDADTNAPVGGAMVTFRSDTLMTYDTTSADDGQYRLLVDVDVPFGQLSAMHDGYDGVQTTVYFDTDIRRVDLPMHKQAGP